MSGPAKAFALLLFVVIVGQVGGYARDHEIRVDARDADVLDCQLAQRGRKDVIGRDGDSIERDRDLRYFSKTAAAARRRDGDLDVARRYDRVQHRAAKRAVRGRERQARARQRRREQGRCTEAYPPVSWWPW